ncbi:hypothetical protein [uncultured virus]|uniref:Uncharacterized protein n=1 Tax=uncultured virus TaxID=340016 RepID=A0A218MM50_9VIRU|nr:hypothetical protein [uncultured virus]
MASKVNLDISERLDITCRRGDTFELTLTLKDSAGVAKTLSTSKFSFLMQVHKPRSSSKSLVIGSVNAGERTDNVFEPFVVDDSGNLTIKATAATMRQVPAGRYVYDLQEIVPSSTSSDDTHTTILRGTFTVNEDVAKSINATKKKVR